MHTSDQNPIQIRQRLHIPLLGIAAPVEFVSFKGLPPGEEPIALGVRAAEVFREARV